MTCLRKMQLCIHKLVSVCTPSRILVNARPSSHPGVEPATPWLACCLAPFFCHTGRFVSLSSGPSYSIAKSTVKFSLLSLPALDHCFCEWSVGSFFWVQCGSSHPLLLLLAPVGLYLTLQARKIIMVSGGLWFMAIVEKKKKNGVLQECDMYVVTRAPGSNNSITRS